MRVHTDLECYEILVAAGGNPWLQSIRRHQVLTIWMADRPREAEGDL